MIGSKTNPLALKIKKKKKKLRHNQIAHVNKTPSEMNAVTSITDTAFILIADQWSLQLMMTTTMMMKTKTWFYEAVRSLKPPLAPSLLSHRQWDDVGTWRAVGRMGLSHDRDVFTCGTKQTQQIRLFLLKIEKILWFIFFSGEASNRCEPQREEVIWTLTYGSESLHQVTSINSPSVWFI